MAKLGINTGSTPNDGTGDTLLAAALKINQNFDEIYNTFGDGTNITPNVSYSEASGVSTYANSSGISSYSSVSGIATYAETSRITITDNGVVIGTAGTINFGDNLTVSPISAGVVTVTGAAAGGGGGESYWVSTAAGIHTLSNVGIGTIIPRGRLQVGSATTNTNEFIITNAGDVGIGTTIPDHFDGFSILTLDGKDYQYLGDTLSGGGNIIFKSKGNKTLDIYSYTDNISGFGTATNIDLHYGLYIQQPSGTSVVSLTKSGNVGVGTTNPTRTLTVVGSGASISQLYVTGVSTFTQPITVSGSQYNSSVFGNGLVVQGNAVSDLSGNNFAVQLQSGLQITDGSVVRSHITSSGNILGAGLTISGTTFTNQLVSSGVVTATSFSGSNTLKVRTTATGVTTSIANNGIGNTNITGFKSYALLKVGLSTAGWLRLYTDSASRTADASRSIGIDPSPGSGVIAEVVTTGISTTQIISPFVMGGNLDDTPSTTIYAAITNLSGITTSISVNLTLLQLEA